MKRLDVFEADVSVVVDAVAVLLRQGFGGHPSLRRDPRLATRSCAAAKGGGANRNRTDDLMLAKHALSQLSYGPGYRDYSLAVPLR